MGKWNIYSFLPLVKRVGFIRLLYQLYIQPYSYKDLNLKIIKNGDTLSRRLKEAMIATLITISRTREGKKVYALTEEGNELLEMLCKHFEDNSTKFYPDCMIELEEKVKKEYKDVFG